MSKTLNSDPFHVLLHSIDLLGIHYKDKIRLKKLAQLTYEYGAIMGEKYLLQDQISELKEIMAI